MACEFFKEIKANHVNRPINHKKKKNLISRDEFLKLLSSSCINISFNIDGHLSEIQSPQLMVM